MNYISATDLVNIYKEINSDSDSIGIPYAMALGSTWSLLTETQKQWLLDFAKEQLANKIG